MYLHIIPLLLLLIHHTTFADDRYRNGCMGVLEPPCRCSQYLINCTNAMYKNTDVFLQITESHFPELDTLIMSGNVFDQLETNLFGPSTRHKLLSKLILSNNSIRSIHAGAFNNLPKLEELSLNDNHISISDQSRLRLFDRLKELKILQLERAFDTKSINADNNDQEAQRAIGHALHVIFGPKAELDHLEYLHLQGNNIHWLTESMYCNLPVLEYLYLQNNSLSTFRVYNASCIKNLVELHLENNRISRYSKADYERLNDTEHLQKIYFAGNPIDCTADQQNFITWLKTDDRIQDINATICAKGVGVFANQPISNINVDQLAYESDGSDYMHYVYIVCGLAIVLLAVLLFCWLYAIRYVLCPRLKSGIWLTASGYEILNKEPEVKAEMV